MQSTTAQVKPAKRVVLPEEAIEVTTSAIGGEYPIFTEDGRIYMDGKVTDLNVSVMGYLESMIPTYKDMFEAQVKTQMIPQNVDTCCYKSRPYKTGKLISWIEKINTSVDEQNPVMEFKKLQYRWAAPAGNCMMYLYFTRPNGDEKKAMKYVDDMIDLLLKTDFHKF
ncbi:hypothetical protein BH09BAC2_BH09BAC2_02060 [soil metagenome]